MKVLMEVLEGGSVGYGGEIIPPGKTFHCDTRDVPELTGKSLAKPVEPLDHLQMHEPLLTRDEVAALLAPEKPERRALFDELKALGLSVSAKTNTKSLLQLAERARAEARK